MADNDTASSTLRTTPTGGLSGEHSPYYRRLLSAGYKGFLQGTIGGSSLYGLMGLGIGAVTGLMLAPFTAGASFALIPLFGGVGILKGASTFGNIGSMAAINAESAELNEQRRYLLDRFHELPEGPEGDVQAAIIKDELMHMHESRKPEKLFHWKTVLIGAAIGAALMLGFMTIAPVLLTHAGLLSMIPHTLEAAHLVIGGTQLVTVGTGGTIAFHGAAWAVGTAIGALTGGMIGLDRHYVRSWFDFSEGAVHDNSHVREAVLERAIQSERLQRAAKADNETRKIIDRIGEIRNYDEAPSLSAGASLAAAAPPAPPAPKIDMPRPQVTETALHSRLIDDPAPNLVPL